MRTFRTWQEDVAQQAAPQEAAPQPLDPRETAKALKASIQRLSVKLGEKGNKYQPLIRYCSRNPQMIQLLDELVTDAGTMQSSLGKRLFPGQG